MAILQLLKYSSSDDILVTRTKYPHLAWLKASPSHGISFLLIISLGALSDCHTVSCWNFDCRFFVDFFFKDLWSMESHCIHKHLCYDRFNVLKSVMHHTQYDTEAAFPDLLLLIKGTLLLLHTLGLRESFAAKRTILKLKWEKHRFNAEI